MNFEKSCGAVVFRYKEEEIEFLLVQSRAHRHWGFPKGHMEGAETEEETAYREVLEETGIRVNILDGFRREIEYQVNDDIHKTVVYYIGLTSDLPVNVQEEEIMNFKWDRYEKTYSKLTYESERTILNEANLFLLNL